MATRSLGSVREASCHIDPHIIDQEQDGEVEGEEDLTTMEHVAIKPCQHSAAHCRMFLKANVAVPAVVVAGLLCCLFVAGYTHWLSKQVLVCPGWAIQCPNSSILRLNLNNIAIVQGVATITYSIGLAAMAYGTKCICESAIWPLLCKQLFSVAQIETYLSAARGSIPSTLISWRIISTNSTALVLFLLAITTILPLVAAPLVGVVFARGDIATEFKSLYPVANGIARIYVQTNPPVAMGDNSQASYVAWALNQSAEPLPEHRLWVIDRTLLFVRGSMNVQAVKAETEITCRGTNITEISSTKSTSIFATRMFEHNWRKLNSSDRVQVQVGKAVAVWVHDFSFDSVNKTGAELVFAAFNGTIENGRNSTLSNGWTVSSILCKVGVEFIDRDLNIGSHPALPTIRPVLSSNTRTEVPKLGKNGTASPTLNENALWFAVAPLLVSMCVNGSQPLFYNWFPTGLPAAYTRAPFSTWEDDYNWSTDNVTTFIEASIGAVAQASSRNNKTGRYATITSQATTKKLYPGRALYLVVPVIIMALGQMTLLYWTTRMHYTEGLPIMRMAGFGELLKSALTDYFLDSTHGNRKPEEASRFGEVNVTFGWTTLLNANVAGLANIVARFRPVAKDQIELDRMS